MLFRYLLLLNDYSYTDLAGADTRGRAQTHARATAAADVLTSAAVEIVAAQVEIERAGVGVSVHALYV
jgi:hypothetical protein